MSVSGAPTLLELSEENSRSFLEYFEVNSLSLWRLVRTVMRVRPRKLPELFYESAAAFVGKLRFLPLFKPLRWLLEWSRCPKCALACALVISVYFLVLIERKGRPWNSLFNWPLLRDIL